MASEEETLGGVNCCCGQLQPKSLLKINKPFRNKVSSIRLSDTIVDVTVNMIGDIDI